MEAFITPLTYSERHGPLVTGLRAAAERGGLKGFWERRLQALLEEPEVRTFSIARTYMRLGDHDRALAWLENPEAP